MDVPSRVLVTGARGFLGRAVMAEFVRRFPGSELVAVSRRRPSATDHLGPALDLCEATAWDELGRFDWVLHLAAQVPSTEARGTVQECYQANVLPVLHLLEACRRWQPSRLVYASSISVYPANAASLLHEGIIPRPDTVYGAAKLAGEHLVALAASAETSILSLRLSSLYGPGQAAGTVLPLFIANAASGKPIELLAGGSRTQDFLHVEDAARGLVDAALSPARGVYNVASGVATSMAELARIVTAQAGWDVDVIDRGGPERNPSVRVDISRAQREWGYAPRITLANGIGTYHAASLAGVY